LTSRISQVEVRDVEEAFRLLDVAMQQSATDHATGIIIYFKLEV